MKVKCLNKSESAIAIAVQTSDADLLLKSSISKQALFMRKVWKEFSTFLSRERFPTSLSTLLTGLLVSGCHRCKVTLAKPAGTRLPVPGNVQAPPG
jgi:hypothetical protein